MRATMAEAITLAKLHGAEPVEQALGVAAAAGRFADGDLQGRLRSSGCSYAVTPVHNLPLCEPGLLPAVAVGSPGS